MCYDKTEEWKNTGNEQDEAFGTKEIGVGIF